MIPGIPYTQLALGAVIFVLLGLYGWAMRRWGWKAHEAKTLKIVLDAERRVTEAMEVARRQPLIVDAEWLQRGSGPPGSGSSVPPGASSAR